VGTGFRRADWDRVVDCGETVEVDVSRCGDARPSLCEGRAVHPDEWTDTSDKSPVAFGAA
jgi:hypothetical protein